MPLWRPGTTGDVEDYVFLGGKIPSTPYWNTSRISNIVDELRKQGETVDDDLLAHISLLPYKHVLPNGTYFIEQDSGEQKSS